MKSPDILVATEPVAGAFEKLGVLYYRRTHWTESICIIGHQN